MLSQDASIPLIESSAVAAVAGSAEMGTAHATDALELQLLYSPVPSQLGFHHQWIPALE